jgi:hypothetical protein
MTPRLFAAQKHDDAIAGSNYYPSPIAQLFRMTSAVSLQQSLYAAAKLGVADLLEAGLTTTPQIAAHLHLNEPALLRVMRFLTSQGVFHETDSRRFENSELSHLLRSNVQNSLRSFVILRGSKMYFAPYAEIVHTLQTGESAWQKLYGKDGFQALAEDPEMAAIFDDAMSNLTDWMGPAIAAAYDFGAWGSLMDVAGGNGSLLATILNAHPGLQGVLADLPAVIERARKRGLLEGELGPRIKLQVCDFFQEVPTGCRAYLMKNVIHDWNDEQARKILLNCRRAIPADGVLLLAQWAIPDSNLPSAGRFMDIAMMIITGGRERDVDEYRELLASAHFHLKRVVPVPGEFSIIEALPV